MLQRLFDRWLTHCRSRPYLKPLIPFVSAFDTFCAEPLIPLRKAPFIRDAIDVKRWMFLVLIALLPPLWVAIWNTGMQGFVYAHGDPQIMLAYQAASHSLIEYLRFSLLHMQPILFLGLSVFIPILLVSYTTGILCEGLVAWLRGHEIAEGFLVTGLLIPLCLPPTLPLWMVAVGTAFGILVGKELFGGTGMNILNPALTARAFLFFTFPANLSGDVWVAPSSITVNRSIQEMQHGMPQGADGVSQATVLQGLNGAVSDIKRIHVDAIASQTMGTQVRSATTLSKQLSTWNTLHHTNWQLGHLTDEALHEFVTSPLSEGGLGLPPNYYTTAIHHTETLFGLGKFSFLNLFFGNIAGSMGETSTFACLLGGLFLILVGIGSWRTMVAVGLGAFATALCFEWAAHCGIDGGAWNPAKFSLPAYRHLVMGGLAFGLVYMATDPVSSPTMMSAQWVYGLLIGFLTIVIRVVNPAYPEGVMLAILFANVFAPLFDYYAIRNYRARWNPFYRWRRRAA